MIKSKFFRVNRSNGSYQIVGFTVWIGVVEINKYEVTPNKQGLIDLQYGCLSTSDKTS